MPAFDFVAKGLIWPVSHNFIFQFTKILPTLQFCMLLLSLLVCCKYVFKVWHFTLLWQPYFDACTLTMVQLAIIPTIIPTIIPSILRSSLNDYLVPHWNLDTRLNIWSHIQTFILEWIFGHTLKPRYSNEWFVWIFNGMFVNAMPGPVKCFWCNLGYAVAWNIHAIYLSHSILLDKVHAEL